MSKIIKLVTGSSFSLRALSQEERMVGNNVMANNLRVKKGEHVMVITDTNKLEREAGLFFEAAKGFTDKITLIEMEPATENAQEPPTEIAEAMKMAEVVFLITTYSLSHTKARKEASDIGVRIASMPGITMDTILRTLSINYDEVASLSKTIAGLLSQGNQAILKSASGTDIIFNLTGRVAYADTGFIHNPGDFNNLPAGEAFISPLEGTTEGVLVFDGCFADITMDQPVKVLVERGQAVDIQGGEGARLLNNKLAKIKSDGAYNIAELGIGTNKMAKLESILLEVEKVYETVHVALGNNATIGGEVDVPFHSDGVILKPTLVVDGTVILKDGEFQI